MIFRFSISEYLQYRWGMETDEDAWDYDSSGTHLGTSDDCFKTLLLHEDSEWARHSCQLIHVPSTFGPHAVSPSIHAPRVLVQYATNPLIQSRFILVNVNCFRPKLYAGHLLYQEPPTPEENISRLRLAWFHGKKIAYNQGRTSSTLRNRPTPSGWNYVHVVRISSNGE